MPTWDETYAGIRQVPRGSTVLTHCIDLRAEQFKFEIRLMREKALAKIAPALAFELRRKRLNPNNHPDIWI